TRSYGDWSSDVCSSDLTARPSTSLRVSKTEVCVSEYPASDRNFNHVEVSIIGFDFYKPVKFPGWDFLWVESDVYPIGRTLAMGRSEERRVGKEWSRRGW